ncbi:MAG: NADH-quinone oxidoreductase subunit M [Rhodothermia bacterium]|nr:NADH-quinone oxidoreductase subunit M [Rhodothermia bacterium]
MATVSLLIFGLPLVAAFVVFFTKGKVARFAALLSAVLTLSCTLLLWAMFDSTKTLEVIRLPWISSLGIGFSMALDGSGLLMVLLTNLLLPFILPVACSQNTEKESALLGLILVMQFALIGVFMAWDGFLFYVFWELALIPIYFIAAIWGGEKRQRITLKFFIYTFAGSLLMLLSILSVYFFTQGVDGKHSFDWAAMQQANLPPYIAPWVLLGFFAAFAVKIPIFPFHTWQPDTYTVAPTAGTMLLAGIMLKMGLFGVYRWMMPIAAEGLPYYQDWFLTLAIIGALFGAIIAIKQDDLKRLVAYSSLSHVGLIAAGLFVGNESGVQGALVQMLNHGINVVGMFYVVHWIERRTGTRSLENLGGLAAKTPRFAILFMIVLLGSIAVPLTNGFVGEFLLLNGLFQYNAWMAVFAGLSIIFGAVYMLRVYQMVMYGTLKAATADVEDVGKLDTILLAPMAFLILLFGVYPQPLFNLTAKSVEKWLALLGG